MPRQRLLHVLLCLAPLLFTDAALAQTSTNEVMHHGGLERTYYLHVPAHVADRAATPDATRVPLVLVLHGRGGTGPGTANLTGLDEVADEHGFIVVYPTGIDNQWNYVDGIPGYDADVPDRAFLRELVAELSTRYPIDSSRVYVAGFSNGGYMAQRLACDATDLFAAFASVGAAGYGGQPSICGDPEAVAILFMHGTADAIVPFAGLRQEGPNGPVTVLASVEQTFAYWTYRLGCGTGIQPTVLPSVLSPTMEVHVLDALDCPPGAELQLVVIVGGGHNWPGRPGRLPVQIGGDVNLDVDASRYIWGFFERHRLE
ncbi:MAG TPA: PHB depolymerase family esterase [Trueperaceae bacterium]|nr:PHB depolymerase family esterase [Trueperaceae bacterium]